MYRIRKILWVALSVGAAFCLGCASSSRSTLPILDDDRQVYPTVVHHHYYPLVPPLLPFEEDDEEGLEYLLIENGLASWYGRPFHGRRTASGERYDRNEMTAAHRTLPFGSTVSVRCLENDRRVTVRITDRGPFIKGRIIDLSEAAARKLGMTHQGIVPVELIVLDIP